MLEVFLLAAALLQAPAPAAQNAPARSAVEERMERALALVRQEKYAQALEEFRAILEQNPGNTRAAAFLAAMELETGRVQECIRRVSALLESDPRNADLHELLGEAYMAAREWERAEKAWRAVLEERPNSEQAHRQLAAVLLQRNRFEDALAEASRALEINPRRSDVRSLRGNVLASLGRLDAAAEDWRAALAADANDMMALSGLAVYLREREPDRALAYARKAVELTGGKALGSLRVLALVHRARGELEQARQVLERAQLSFPDSDLLAADLASLSSPPSGGAPRATSPPPPPARPPEPARTSAVASGPPALAPPASPVGVTLGASPRDLRALVREPQPPAARPSAPVPVTVARAAAQPSKTPVLVPVVSPAGITLGASLRDLWPLLGEPQPPPAATPQTPSEPISLGEAARRLREEKQKKKKP